ncbi:MAG: cytochrome c biogenesis protein CcsA [Candidatus Marinimicrobia bacterium]|nr:cytochrome c biogenesis protein CcsA [Candidatus Neomarinimicrobiota bacterium]
MSQIIINSLNVLLPILYALTSGIYLLSFYSKNKTFELWALGSLLTSVSLHLAYLLSKAVTFHYFPVTNVFESFSLIAFNLAAIYLLVEMIKEEGKTGPFFISLAFLFQMISSMFMQNNGSHSALLENPMFGFHVFATLLGLSAMAVAAIYAFMYWMLAKEIKAHRFGSIYQGLPSLETLEGMGRAASIAGVVSLGLGIFLGHLWAYKILGYFFSYDLKIIITDVAWLAYLIGWLVVRLRNLGGLRTSQWAFWGFIALFAALMIVNIFATTFHRFS